MRKRIIFGLILLAALAIVVEVDHVAGSAWLGSLVVLAMATLAQRELMAMMGVQDARPKLLANLGAALLFFSFTPPARGEAFDPSAVLTASILALLVWGTFALQASGTAGQRSIMKGLQGGIVAMAYVALPMSFLIDLAWTHGTLVAGALVLASKCGDMGGYLVGSLIGKHKVMPEVSPNKSWQGSCGGLLMTVVVLLSVDALAPGLFPDLGMTTLIVLALVINIATQLGDFAESMVKRCCEVKDSANLVPTFGGALDIIDSLIFAMPAAAVAMRFMG